MSILLISLLLSINSNGYMIRYGLVTEQVFYLDFYVTDTVIDSRLLGVVVKIEKLKIAMSCNYYNITCRLLKKLANLARGNLQLILKCVHELKKFQTCEL